MDSEQDYLVAWENKLGNLREKDAKQWVVVKARTIQEAVERAFVRNNVPIYVVQMYHVSSMIKQQLTEIVPFQVPHVS